MDRRFYLNDLRKRIIKYKTGVIDLIAEERVQIKLSDCKR